MRAGIFWMLMWVTGWAGAQEPLPAIGLWREHLPYNSAIDLAAGEGRVWCATPYSLFCVDPSDNTIERYSRMTGLSETGISAIHYDSAGGKLLVAYTNSNLDILYRNDIFNVPDIKRTVLSGDKTIYQAYAYNRNFYLSTGLGVVVINGDRYEVKETWFMGAGGNTVKVNGFTTDAGYYYAATEEGLKRVALTGTNPANYANWQLLSGSGGLPSGAAQQVITIQNKVVVRCGDALYVQNGNNWSLFYTDTWPIVQVSLTENKIAVCERRSNGLSRVVYLNADGTEFRQLANVAAVSFPRDAILLQGNPWVADQFACLSRFGNGNSYQSFVLNSPQGIASGEMLVYQDVFYASAGSVSDSWNYLYNGDGMYLFSEGSWNHINRYRYPVIDSLLDYITLAVDKRDQTVWAGSFGGGLLHIMPGPAFEIFKQGRLGETVGDPGSYRVAGLAFDRENNLWIANYGAAQTLRVRKADGSWGSFSPPFTLPDNALAQVLVDDNGYKWLVSPKGNGLICFHDNGTIDNTGDDQWIRYTSGPANGNLPSADVLCAAKDRNGFIWVGTSDGVGVIQCPEAVFRAGGCPALWPIVPNGNFAGYLFKGQAVRAIAVDGADRKWVATANGVFLVSANGEKLVHRFTEDNSPLLSNDVKKIAIDGKTGEVFFATAKGICSFRGTATEGAQDQSSVLVFPNPVPPGYTGTIAIRGLVNDAVVKITEPDGRLVYQTRALGGQAVWDGRNYRGQKISSGVYLVLVNNDGKTEAVAAKIFFIQR